MSRREFPLKGFCYLQGKVVEVFARMPNGKYLRLEGKLDDAKRSFGRHTRERSSRLTTNSPNWLDKTE
jgi:hypothetical protein